MPGGDRRGPEGRGPMTGRGLGYCNSNNDIRPFFIDRGRGMGYGCGYTRGRGGGRGAGYRSGRILTVPPSDEISIDQRNRDLEVNELKEKIRSLEEELQRTVDRLEGKQVR